jgi:hypothetical protein
MVEARFKCEFVREDELVGLAVEINGSLAEEGAVMLLSSSV